MSGRLPGGAALYEQLLESAPDALVIVDRGGRILIVNGQTERLFSYPRDHLIGNEVDLLLPERFRSGHHVHRDRYAGSPTFRPMGAGLELLGRRSDGSEFPVDISLSPIELDGEVLVAAAIRDATERKAVEHEMRRLAEEAQRANAAKSEFLSRMSHELRTPLNAIIGFGQLLELEQLPGEQGESVKHIVDAGRHLLSLINEVLDIARAEAGTFAISVEPVEIDAVVARAVELVQPLAAERGARLDVSGPAGLHAQADQQRLLQVLLNLLGNGVKYGHERGVVSVAWGREGDRVRVEVADDGPGIDPAVAEVIFDPFERGAEETVEGTGLGLAVARTLVQAMGGSIGVESGEGGSTFFVELPVADLPPAGRPPLLPSGAVVLHIDDNRTSRRLVERIVSDAGCDYVGVADGDEGLDAALARPPAVILLDLHLAGASGLDVLERLRQQPRLGQTRVVVLSADASRDADARARAAGADDFVAKPVDAAILRAVLAPRTST